MVNYRRIIILLSITVILLSTPIYAQERFSFAVTSDQRQYSGSGYNSSSYFRGVVEAVQRQGSHVFMISPGDIDPPADSFWTIQQILGVDYLWYPVVGNHELPGAGTEAYNGANMEWLRAYDYDRNGSGAPPDIVNAGPTGCPQTTYSFDYENAHFVVINEYCDTGGDDVTTGDIPDHLYNWLQADLAATEKDHVFVFGHEPAYPQPDADNGRMRHADDSLNENPTNRDRFWSLLKSAGVSAYFCGHTHNYSAVQIDGVWQLDSGHARGQGDTGAAGTFLMVHVNGSTVTFNAYRDIHDGSYDYEDIIHFGTIRDSNALLSVSFQDGVSPDSGYLGTHDTVLSQNDPTANDGGNVTLYADGDDPPGSGNDLSTLLYWDISAIPPGSTVKEVSITLNVLNLSNDTYKLYEIKRDWVESESTWNSCSSTQAWEIPGALGSADRGNALIGSYSPGKTGSFVINLNAEGVAVVQQWVDNPIGNHGLIVANDSAADGFDFDSSEASVAARRPKLTVRYTEENKAMPWIPLLLLD